MILVWYKCNTGTYTCIVQYWNVAVSVTCYEDLPLHMIQHAPTYVAKDQNTFHEILQCYMSVVATTD